MGLLSAVVVYTGNNIRREVRSKSEAADVCGMMFRRVLLNEQQVSCLPFIHELSPSVSEPLTSFVIMFHSPTFTNDTSNKHHLFDYDYCYLYCIL